ncbi:lipopolysaccharide kinase InaA family protein [Aquisphaera insulae]|uniref:lipopolysaccharide kinase InaA family protein n=1 Tax=Aquisphaera insulae TaxID=2712864 RepID=UPI0013EC0891|nr:lipopolysaccharide kinase InaA family protein [Aquisphaera insulae]
MTTLQRDRSTAPARPPHRRMFKPPEWAWAESGGVGWWFRGPWRDALLGPEGLRLEQWRAEGRLSVVKSGPHRIVYRADLPEGAIFIKHYLVPDYRAMLRQWFRRGKGRNEGKRSELLQSIGVATIFPIALGERRKRKFLLENYLVTWEIAGAVALDEFLEFRLHELPEPSRSRVRQQIARELAILTARLHNHGITHIDFHPGNVLIRLQAGDRVELSMIDLDALRHSHGLSWKQSQQNLALLDHYFWLRSSRVDRHRFVRAYLAAREGDAPEPRAFARGIEELTRAWAERLWRRWGRRCRSTNKYFRVFRGDRTWAVAAREVDAASVQSLLADPDAPFRDEQTTILKNSRTTTVAEATLLVEGEPRRVVYKRFNRKKWIDPWLNLFRPSRAWRSWQAGQDLSSRGIPTPTNLLFLSRKRDFRSHPFSWFLPHETYLATLKEPSAQPLSQYIRTVLPSLPPEARGRQVRRLNDALARLIRDLHERSLSHRDLKASNILIRPDEAGSGDLLSLIDLVGVRLMNPVPRGRRVQNLARLSLSLANAPGRTRTETLRFLRSYLPWGLSPHSDWKSLWRDVQRAIAAKQERNQRRGRPLS